MNLSHTDYDIENAGRKAEQLAREDFAAGKPYKNPYTESNVIYYTYAREWYFLTNSKTENKND